MFQFTSERKAMTIVVRDVRETNPNKFLVFSKGADSSISKMLADPEGEDAKTVFEDVLSYAGKGLRTLVFAMKEIELNAEEINWKNSPEVSVENIECGLTVLGATGVEDSLQEDVKMCVDDFRQAGIAVWMLTGDMGLTAKQIGI